MTVRLRLGLLLALSGCATHTAGQPADRILTTADTLIPESNELLARPVAVSVDRAGLLYITDARTSTIVVLDPKTRLSRTIGREGEGRQSSPLRPGPTLSATRCSWWMLATTGCSPSRWREHTSGPGRFRLVHSMDRAWLGTAGC